MMRYFRTMTRPAALLVCVSLGGCATAGSATADAQTSALERAVAQEEDLGAPGPTDEQRQAAREARAEATLEDPDAEHIDFDSDVEANDAPVDVVTVPGDRSPSKSLIQDITMGPSS